MGFLEFKNKVITFFKEKNWDLIEENGVCGLVKNYNNKRTVSCKNKFLFNDKLFFDKLTNVFHEFNIPQEKLNSLINPAKDTDLIIAGLQIANKFLQQKSIVKNSFYAFQPVVRFNKFNECGVIDGYLSSFINISLIDIKTSIEEYLFHADLWVTIISKLSLHSSGLKIFIKEVKEPKRNFNGIEFNNGMKLQFVYKNIVVGVANIYEVECSENILVSDFGFGYERLIWCLNGEKNFFTPLLPNYEVLYGDKVYNDRIRTVTLLILSGIVPGAVGVKAKVRKLIKGIIEININYNIEGIIEYYYNYFAKFINPNVTLYQVKRIISYEIERSKKLLIINDNNINASIYESLESICEKKILISEGVNAEKHI